MGEKPYDEELVNVVVYFVDTWNAGNKVHATDYCGDDGCYDTFCGLSAREGTCFIPVDRVVYASDFCKRCFAKVGLLREKRSLAKYERFTGHVH